MVKVLLQVPNTPTWVGGLNYFINLCEALNTLNGSEIEPVIFNDNSLLPPPLCDYQSLIWPDKKHNGIIFDYYYRFIRKINRLFKHHDDFISFLIKNDIRLFSHGYPLGKTSPIPSLCWIPDFQHRYLPQFFTEKEIKDRDKHHNIIAENSNALLFSSNVALNDFRKFHPDSTCSTYVLHFVAVPYSGNSSDNENVFNKYGIIEPFFHVPNQLWAHKNHLVIVEALRICQSRGKCPLVISTGLKNDYRNPGYFRELSQKVREYGLEERLRFLGLIEYENVALLMRQSVCIVNPSLFEGWSTTVEEGKSLGKKILLSDIPVHREQSPERGLYFPSNDPEALAELMLQITKDYNQIEENESIEKAKADLPIRMKSFASEYEMIVKNIIRCQH